MNQGFNVVETSLTIVNFMALIAVVAVIHAPLGDRGDRIRSEGCRNRVHSCGGSAANFKLQIVQQLAQCKSSDVTQRVSRLRKAEQPLHKIGSDRAVLE